MSGLLDTTVIVDLLRGYQPAVAWLQGQSEQLRLNPVVWLEVIEGAANRTDQEKAIRLLGHFDRIEVPPPISSGRSERRSFSG